MIGYEFTTAAVIVISRRVIDNVQSELYAIPPPYKYQNELTIMLRIRLWNYN